MKKIIIMILSAVCVFAMLSFAACGKEKHKHSFTIENATSEYLCSEATCIEAAKYYYSCSCGEKGTATFDCGEALGHSFTNYEPNNDATYEKDGTKTATCNRCSATDTILDEGTKFESKIIFKSLVFDGLSASLTVPNAQNDYNFLDEIEIEGIADYKITTDEEGNDVIEADNINLSQGNNIFYVKMYIDGECKATYIITIYRRFIYTVTFNTNGGSEVESQQVEEDFCATMPDAPTKDGYTFDGWDYDFTKPVKSDIAISAKWTANKNTAYKVEYYLQNLEDDNYTLEETSKSSGTTDTTVNAEQKTFEHFTLNEYKSNLIGNVNGDGSLVLKVYYTRNTYKILAKSNDNVGTFTKINGTYRYNKELSLKVTSTNLGYIFNGWYDGETLLSTEKEYIFTVEKAVTITANWEMDVDLENFEFISTEETCVITGVKNKSITSVKIPDYVTSIGSRAFYNCSELIGIEIPNNVTTIKDNAFRNCSSLIDIKISDSVTYIGENVFRGCNSVENVTMPFIGASRTASGYDSMFGYIFGVETSKGGYKGDGIFQYFSMTSYCYYYYFIPNTIKTIIITDGITKINTGAFRNMESVLSIVTPDSVTTIEDDVFYNCTNLLSVSLGKNLTEFGYNYYECLKLIEIVDNSSLNIGGDDDINVKKDGVSDIVNQDGYLFYNFKNNNYLVDYVGHDKQLVLPNYYNGQTYKIYKYAFNYNDKIESVVMGEGVTDIGEYAFYECTNLKEIAMNEGLNTIGIGAFFDCYKILELEIPKTMTKVERGAFYECRGIKTLRWNAIEAVCEVNDNDIVYPFEDSKNLTDVIFGESVNKIPNYLLARCKSINKILIPDNVTTIGSNAFLECSGLLSVTIGKNVKTIGYNAFNKTIKLVEVINKSDINIEKGSQSAGGVAYYALNVKKDGESDIINQNGYLFFNADETNYLLGYIGDETQLTLPGDYNKQKYEIYNYAFYNNQKIQSVTINNGTISIGDNAFLECKNLISVIIDNESINISYSAFKMCTQLEDVHIYGNLSDIEDFAFYNCVNLQTFEIPDKGLISIGQSAFYGCKNLTDIVLPNTLISIGSSAFENCSALETFVMPDSVTDLGKCVFSESGITHLVISRGLTNIGNNAFSRCYSLESVEIPDSITSMGNYAFSACSSLESVVIPNSVVSIENGAFSGCSSLKSVVIPNSVVSIGNAVFYECGNLESVVIPDSVTSLGPSAFSYCKALKSAIIGNGLTTIEEYTFESCVNLLSVKLSDNLESIGEESFKGCENLAELVIPDSVKTIGKYAFYKCTALSVLTIGKNVENIYDKAFQECENLTDLYWNATNCLQVGSYGDSAFVYCNNLTNVIFGENVTIIPDCLFYANDGIKNIVIPDSVQSIGEDAFIYCDNLSSVKIGKGVQEIGWSAFRDCINLLSIEIPDNVTELGNGVFQGCVRLSDVIIGKGITRINRYSFKGCVALSDLIIPDNVTSIGERAFGEAAIKSITFGSGLTDIEEYAFERCKVSVIEIPDSVQNIGNNAFAAAGIEELTIGNGVQNIYSNVFYACVKLKTVKLGDGVQTIGVNMFSECGELTEIIFGNGLKEIKEYAFEYCISLKNIIIPDGVTTIEYNAFARCTELESVVLPNSITTLKSCIFDGCAKLKTVVIPDDFTCIKGNVFSYCSGLTEFVIPNSWTSIQEEMFKYCSGLTSITIPKTVTSIGWFAFGCCENLNTIIFKGTKEEWEAITKSYQWNHEISPTCKVYCEDGEIELTSEMEEQQ